MSDNIRKSVYSDLKIFYHADKIQDILNDKRTAPVYIRIKPTNVCNQNCYYCGSKDDNVPEERRFDRKAMIPWDKMEEIIQDIADMGVKAVTFSGGGEPLVYPYIEDTLELIRQKKIDYSIITNGQALEGRKAELLADAKWIRVSIESAHAKTYAGIRGVNTFDRVIKNIENFVQQKQPWCTVGINCVVTRDNAQEIYDLCKLMAKLGVDNIKLSPLRLDGDLGEYHRPIQESVKDQIARAKKECENDHFKIVDKYDGDAGLDAGYHKPYHRCLIQEIFTVIGADCKVYLCHQRAYTKNGDIGSLKERSFKELWFAEDTIKKVRELDACQECDFRCVFDERNILLNDLMSIDKNHINFI
ncbi:MAG: radical SAM protein [Bacteroidales bacterium]|nr:radical SAM protein [Lachnoclostridium sp.]MCM1383931.1 radical SAM protein [Lachnoclostridium sp.]MCM1464640.1 radical SAM protein [Bacteroidales bacterium]